MQWTRDRVGLHAKALGREPLIFVVRRLNEYQHLSEAVVMSEGSEVRARGRKRSSVAGIGVGVGAAVGVAIGAAFGRLALGLALGTAIGAVVDVVTHVKRKILK